MIRRRSWHGVSTPTPSRPSSSARRSPGPTRATPGIPQPAVAPGVGSAEKSVFGTGEVETMADAHTYSRAVHPWVAEGAHRGDAGRARAHRAEGRPGGPDLRRTRWRGERAHGGARSPARAGGHRAADEPGYPGRAVGEVRARQRHLRAGRAAPPAGGHDPGATRARRTLPRPPVRDGGGRAGA